MGMRYYVSAGRGCGGRLKASPSAFRVTERPGVDPEPLEADAGDYPYLVVEAVASDRDTHGLIDALAGAMGIHPGRIAAAGTKDANAITTQWLTLRGVSPDALPDLAAVELTPVGRLGRQLEFGDHAGNHFAVRVDDVRDPQQLAAVHTEVTDDGDQVTVPNYFGHQRFGARRAVTHRVGWRLLRGEYDAAVRTYLTATSEHEPERTRRARADIADALEAADPAAAIAATPGYLDYERQLLSVLDTEGLEAAQSAIESLPWSLVRLFVHAVQSSVFNELASERLRRGHSLVEPAVGDVICFVDDEGRVDPERAQPVTEARLSVANRHTERGRAAVVGPLLGPETPSFVGPIGDLYRSVLSGLGIDRADFADVEAADVRGTWRPLAVSTTVERDGSTFAFDLPPGSYATVLLREYLKVDPVRMA